LAWKQLVAFIPGKKPIPAQEIEVNRDSKRNTDVRTKLSSPITPKEPVPEKLLEVQITKLPVPPNASSVEPDRTPPTSKPKTPAAKADIQHPPTPSAKRPVQSKAATSTSTNKESDKEVPSRLQGTPSKQNVGNNPRSTRGKAPAFTNLEDENHSSTKKRAASNAIQVSDGSDTEDIASTPRKVARPR